MGKHALLKQQVYSKCSSSFSSTRQTTRKYRRYLVRAMTDRELNFNLWRIKNSLCFMCACMSRSKSMHVCVCIRSAWLYWYCVFKVTEFVSADFLQECQKMPAHCLFELNQSISHYESITVEARGSVVSLSLEGYILHFKLYLSV